MGVNGNGALAKGDIYDHIGRFAANAWKVFKLLRVAGPDRRVVPAVLAKADNVLCLCVI